MIYYSLFCLGTVTPSLVKYSVDSLDDSGKTVGTLGAFNTIRKHYRNICADFMTIPAVEPLSRFSFCGITVALAAVYFLSSHRGQKEGGIGSYFQPLLWTWLFSSFAFWQNDLGITKGESIYNYLQVSGDDRRVILSTDVLFGVAILYMKDGLSDRNVLRLCDGGTAHGPG